MKTMLIAMCLAAAACDKTPAGPQITCDQVAPYTNSLLVAAAPEADRAQATADLAAELPKTIESRKKKNLSQDVLKCMMDSKSPADVGKCK